MHALDGRVVWDTDSGSVGDDPPPERKPPDGDGIVRIRRETGGRGGKTVTTISGIQAEAGELKALAKQLKRACGVGGSVTDFVIELQGDHRDRAATWLRERGYEVVLAGG